MRKIEKQMLNAISEVKYFCLDNTMVKAYNTYCDIYLHGNHIAEYDNANNKLTVNVQTLAKWPTPTTKRRLRALGANVTTKKGQTFLDGVLIA